MVVHGGRKHFERTASMIWFNDRSALQTLHKVSAKAREGNYYQGGGTHSWVEHYERRVTSDQSCLNEWHVMDCLESRRPPSPDSVRARPTERGETEKVIRSKLKEIMMSVDLDEVTSKFIRTKLEEELDMDLGEFKSFIDQEMLVILGQMDAPTEIFDHVYLGSEWNASNYEELQRNGVGHILNVTREIDNFFPGTFDYLNVRVYDDEQTDLLKHWDDTFKYITKAKNEGSKVLVHCKMGISRSASVVIAYAMKAYNWDFNKALLHVKEKRSCIKPNTNFLTQLETYQGILDAMKNKEKLQRSKSETNLKSPIIFKKIQKMSMGGVTTVVVHQQEISKFNGLQSTLSGQDLRQLGGRPKSWSPDNLTTREIKEGVKSSPGFMSLEDLSQKSVSNESVQETKSSLARHVLMPCDNGESYSVSPNQIVHLPGHEVVIPATRNDEQTVCGSETNPSSSINNSVKTALTSETWDPGEGNLQSDRTTTTTTTTATSAVCDPQSINSVRGDGSVVTYTPVWTSSAVILTQSAVSSSSFSKVPESQANNVAPQSDPFSNQFDRVFDKEEMKNNQPQQQPQRRATIQIVPENLEEEVKNQRDCPSRQSSWSSYDSAVVLGFHEKNELSRHSSWGSGDTKLLPSRNSSWGSYDMRPKTSIYYMEDGEKTTDNQNGIYSYDKEDIPWHPGTVKRTKQRLEGATRQLSNDSVNSNSCTSLNKSSSSDTLHINFVEAINETLVDSAISDKIDIPRTEKRLPLSPRLARLSASAPESCSIELVTKEGTSLSRSASNVTEPLTEQRILVKLQKSFLENTQKNKLSKKLEDSSFDNSLGKVQNLKKEFEAKSSITCLDQMNIPDQSDTVAKPSSKNRVASLPSSPISNHQAKESATQKSEDLSFKTIRSVFEKNEEENHPVKRRHRFPNAVKNNSRYSYIEGLERSPKVMATPFIYTLKPDKMETEFKRPPIGPTEIRSTIIASATKKKQQQFGKTHPVSMLSRQHNTVYNTM
ncbi:hypothetical protein ABEB36_009875 [Hypothenemus hampei]|uniref:protein-serine/threonine phosphatase n=1 Tax=Hypothenemus hampei TaxID=57062 RepID=A0ABD1EHS2_HYPHA